MKWNDVLWYVPIIKKMTLNCDNTGFPRPDWYTYWEGDFLVFLWMQHFIPFFRLRTRLRRLDVAELRVVNKED